MDTTPGAKSAGSIVKGHNEVPESGNAVAVFTRPVPQPDWTLPSVTIRVPWCNSHCWYSNGVRAAIKRVVAGYKQGGKVCRVHCNWLQWGIRGRKDRWRFYNCISNMLNSRCELLQSILQQREVRCQTCNPITTSEQDVVVGYNRVSKICRVPCKSCNGYSAPGKFAARFTIPIPQP